MSPIEKLCTGCHTWKPVEEFNKSKKGAYGVSGRCKKCKAFYNATLRQNKVNKPGGLQAEREKARLYREAHPQWYEEKKKKIVQNRRLKAFQSKLNSSQ